MRLFLLALVVLIIAVIFAVIAHDDPGYIVINYKDWVIETSVVLAVVLIGTFFISLYFLTRLFFRTRHLPKKISYWQQVRNENQSNRALTNGLVELSTGDWIKAEKFLVRHVNRSKTPLINYLSAARAAQKQNKNERSDYYIQQAYKSMPTAELAIGLTQAELQLDQGHMERALATLTRLKRIAPKNDRVLKLLLRLYIELQDWERVLEILPVCQKRNVVMYAKAQQLFVMAHSELLKKATAETDLKSLQQTWQRVGKSLRQNSALVQIYVQGLMHQGLYNEAEAEINQALQREWDQHLVCLYGMLQDIDVNRQIRYAEGWLSMHSKDPVLLLTLGRLYVRNKLWAQARQYFQTSLTYDKQTEACTELAQLLERLGEKDKALEYYRMGLQLIHAIPGPVLKLKNLESTNQ